MQRASDHRVQAGAIALAIGCAVGAAGRVAGQCQEAKLRSSDATEDQYFGRMVALDGDRALVAAPFDGDLATGAVYAFERGGRSWVQVTAPAGLDGGENLGFGLDLDGDVAVAGAYLDFVDDVFTGSAYVYRWRAAGWGEEQRLFASDGAASDQFGLDAAVDGDVIVVGARQKDVGGGATGAAYVFRFDGRDWLEEARLVGSGTPRHFADALAIDGDVIVAGEGRHGHLDNGRVWIFRWDGAGWPEEAVLRASDDGTNDDFGDAVALRDKVLVVGAAVHPVLGEASGAALVYRYRAGRWVHEQTLGGPRPYGYEVATSGHRIAVSHRGDGAPFTEAVTVYRYDEEGAAWVEEATIGASDDDFGNGFGGEIALDAGRVLSGASNDDDVGFLSGSAYVHDLDDSVGADCNGNRVCDALEIASGDVEDCDESGVPDECEGLDDTDLDGIPDVCDVCPAHADPDQADCDGDGIGDVCAIADGMSLDCNANGVPDECEGDCNDNGVPDDCDVASGASPDCDGNGVPDACDFDCNGNGRPDPCDVADGTSADCNADGVPDECDLAYRADDGAFENGVGLPGTAADLIWLNAHTVTAGAERVIAIGIAWWDLAPGVPTRLLLYRDPTGDGDPIDAALVRVVEIDSVATAPDELHLVPIDPIRIGEAGDVFFVGAVMTAPAGTYPLAIDLTFPSLRSSWITTAGPGEANIEDLSDNPFAIEIIDDVCCAGDWMLRAYTSVGGIGCGDLDGDGDVDVVDLALLLAAWGEGGGGPADLDGDGTVGMLDLLRLLTFWTV